MEAELKPKSHWQTAREWVFAILVALVIALPVRYFIAEPFIVQGPSMDPTFASNQFLIVDRLTYRFASPNRGDVIVFQYPNDPSVYYIKRIIGLPGETVSVEDGKVTVFNTANPKGLVLTENYISPIHASHDTEKVTLSDKQYWVLGDNRLESSDSRRWGPLDRKYITGRPLFRLFPLSKLSILPGQASE